MKYFNLKGIQIIGFIALMIISTASCRRGKTTDIVMKTDNTYQRITYSGRVVFNKDQTGIESIAKGGYLKFERDGRKVEAEPNTKGQIAYEFDGDDKVTTLTADQQLFVTDAVKTIIKERSRQLAAKR